ncbi:MAG: GNAT family N-acetyltransferase [Lachnospiraceae bacterium]|nr:GNAT family N-acetyltransferase [Lachnospiraceae bacterium]
MLYLKKVSLEDKEKEYAFVSVVPEDENGFINEWLDISEEDFEEKALKVMLAQEKGENLPAGYVPQTIFFLWDENEIVGQFNVRHYLCESLMEGSGHIGYFIEKEHRGKGYATEGLRLTLQLAKDIIPEEEIYLRVNKDNPASLRVMQKNGGYIHHEDDSKYYVRIVKEEI